MKDLVSIIMPAYNAEKTIELAVNSILNQTYDYFELIICDDGSTDETFLKINSLSDKRIKIIRNERNLGNLYTTNKLLELCEGKYIALQDADDYSLETRIEKQLNIINKYEVDLVGTQTSLLIGDSILNVIKNPRLHHEIIDIIDNSRRLPIVWGSVLFKREIYEKVGGFDPVFDRVGAADFNWLLRAIKFYMFSNIEEPLYVYRQHSESFTKKNDINNSFSVAKLYSEDIAFDIYENTKNEDVYDFQYSKEIFLKKLKSYELSFLKDKKRILNIYYYKLIHGQIKLFQFFKIILKIDTKLFNKINYIIRGILVKIFGLKFIEFLKNNLR